MSGTAYEKKKPSRERIRALIEVQNNKCLYCDIEFGTAYVHPTLKRFMTTKICYDHFVPFTYSQNNKDENFVLACGTCNGIKSAKMFNNMEDAREYVRNRRTQKGFTPEIYVL